MTDRKYLGESILVLVTLIWGATFAIIKTALIDVSPMLFISIRFSFALLILLPFVLKIFKNVNKAAIMGGAILGLSYFLGFATQTAGLRYTSATKSAFITGTFVLFIPLFQYLLEKKAPGKGNIIGIVLVLLGLIFLSSKGNSFFDIFNEIGGNFNVGDFLTLLCAFNFAFYVVYLDIVTRKFSFMPLVFMQIAVTAVGSIIFAIIFNIANIETPFLNLSSPVIGALLYTSILSTVLTTIMQTRFQKTVSPAKAGVILSLEPLFAAIIAFFMLHEKISNFGVLGCLLIFSGLLASELMDKPEAIYE